MKSRIAIVATLLCLAVPCCLIAGETAADSSPQSLYLQAGKLERQGELVTAKETYERIIDLFPTSEFAVKANDRLLELQKLPAKAERLPVKDAAADPPLPADPVKKRGIELARLLQKATHFREEELNSRYYAFTTRYGHNYNRTMLVEQRKGWETAADEKVVKQFGMGLDAIGKQLEQTCRQLGIDGRCTEADILAK